MNSNSDRTYLPPLRGRFIPNLKELVANMNTVLFSTNASSLTELCNLCYCAAQVVTEECGVKIPNPTSNSSPPPWEKRILLRIKKLKQDLSRLRELICGRLKSQQKINNLVSRYNLQSRSAEEVCEELHQTVKSLSHRLKCYRHKQSCHKQNKLFLSNQHKFYQQMTHQSTTLAPPPKEDTLQFWSKLWSAPEFFNKQASVLIKAMPQWYSHLDCDIFNRALKRIPNWKSPGPDFIHGFWLKKFNALHSAFLYYFNEVLSGTSSIDQSLVTGKTVLIVKDHSKGNIPSNYCPITCLSTVWKFLTSVLRLVLCRHLDSVSAIPFQQKGGTYNVKGSKDHLIVDKFVMSEAKRRRKNLYMAWLDVKKAYDSVPHDWILYCLKLFGVHDKIVRFLECAMSQ